MSYSSKQGDKMEEIETNKNRVITGARCDAEWRAERGTMQSTIGGD